jgi:hypothetical protein
MSRQTDENELRALFAEIDVPAGLDRWRDRIADVHAVEVEPHHDDEPEPAETDGATIVALPTGRELRPGRRRTRSVAVAAAAAVIVGLGGVVVTAQLFDEPPADPTMIIDGPDDIVSTPPKLPSEEHSDPSGSTTPPAANPGNTQSDGQPGGTGEPVDNGDPGPGNEAPGGPEPAWPAMVGDPTAANTGVPLGASLGDHYGDLRITTAGQVVKDVRVTGTVIVDAPNVTLSRVLVVPPSGAAAVRQNAGKLTVENSELSGSLTQSASGLVVRRSRLQFGVTITSGAELYDSYLEIADVLVPSGATSVLLRHNVMGRVTMNDRDSPIRGVTIENGLLTEVDAPTGAGSASIHVLGNRFRGNAPSTGWNSSASDYQWSNNTYADSGAPANP